VQQIALGRRRKYIQPVAPVNPARDLWIPWIATGRICQYFNQLPFGPFFNGGSGQRSQSLALQPSADTFGGQRQFGAVRCTLKF
jgi:hypothetical protein